MRFHLDPTLTLLLKRGMRRGLLTLRRERGWGTSVGALVGVVLLLQLTFLLSAGVQGADRLLRAQTDLRLPIREGVADAAVQQFLIALRSFPDVETVEYVTREKALERQRAENPDLVVFLDQFKLDNPFPDTVGVTLRSLSSYDAFVRFVREPQWQAVVDPAFLSQSTDQERALRHMLRVTDAGRSLAGVFLGVTTVILLCTVIELVRRRASSRREEVFIERMSGAQEASLVVPFATEASVLLLCALLLGAVLAGFILYELPTLIPALAEGGTFDALREQVAHVIAVRGPLFFLVELFLIPAVGFLGAYLGTRGERMTMASV